MAKTKKPKKQQLTDIPLLENVRILKSGAWGYILHGKAIFKSTNVEAVNSFSKWVTDTVLKEAERMQLLEGEPKILPQCHVCDTPRWSGGGNNYESVVRQKY